MNKTIHIKHTNKQGVDSVFWGSLCQEWLTEIDCTMSTLLPLSIIGLACTSVEWNHQKTWRRSHMGVMG